MSKPKTVEELKQEAKHFRVDSLRLYTFSHSSLEELIKAVSNEQKESLSHIVQLNKINFEADSYHLIKNLISNLES